MMKLCVMGVVLALAATSLAIPITAPTSMEIKPEMMERLYPNKGGVSLDMVTRSMTSYATKMDLATGLVQTRTRCWWGFTCDDVDAQFDGVCTERCNCQYQGNETLGLRGCTSRLREDVESILAAHCLDESTMGPCGSSGALDKYAYGYGSNEDYSEEIECYPLQDNNDVDGDTCVNDPAFPLEHCVVATPVVGGGTAGGYTDDAACADAANNHCVFTARKLAQQIDFCPTFVANYDLVDSTGADVLTITENKGTGNDIVTPATPFTVATTGEVVQNQITKPVNGNAKLDVTFTTPSTATGAIRTGTWSLAYTCYECGAFDLVKTHRAANLLTDLVPREEYAGTDKKFCPFSVIKTCLETAESGGKKASFGQECTTCDATDCCAEINGCDTDGSYTAGDCGTNAKCVDTLTTALGTSNTVTDAERKGYTCACEDGYTQTGTTPTGSAAATCAANTCTPTQVANSDKSGSDAITGDTGTTITVTCNDGYSGSGEATCETTGLFSTVTCSDANGCASNPCLYTVSRCEDVDAADFAANAATFNCVCALGYSGTPGIDGSGCSPTLCSANQHVDTNVCTDCADGTTNGANDNASGADTTCTATLCLINQHVVSNVCTDCAGATTNPANDDASGSDTTCT